ncbi:hypothetical protein D3C86_1766630 [compost metagenome]
MRDFLFELGVAIQSVTPFLEFGQCLDCSGSRRHGFRYYRQLDERCLQVDQKPLKVRATIVQFVQPLRNQIAKIALAVRVKAL